MSIYIHAANGDEVRVVADLENGVSIESRDDLGRTPLMVALASSKADCSMIQLLLDRGADVNALSTPRPHVGLDPEAKAALYSSMGMDPPDPDESPAGPAIDSVLGIAAKRATYEQIVALLRAGADATYVNPNGYSILLDAIHRPEGESAQEWIRILGALIDAGAPLDVASIYGETAIGVASHRSEFAVVEYLLSRGASADRLGWTPLFHKIATGDLTAVQSLAAEGADLNQRDSWDRTPLLLSVSAGRIEIADFLLRSGVDRTLTGRCGRTAPQYAIDRDDGAMLAWLIEMGWDVEAIDEFGAFPLVEAAQRNAANCVRVLLEAGAAVDRRDTFGEAIISQTSSPEILRILLSAGEDPSDIPSGYRLSILGTTSVANPPITEQDYQQHKHRVFGTGNPHRMNNPFWDLMVRSRNCAYHAASAFGDSGADRTAVWCCTRYGQSLTPLPDGRFVEIAGEHEDHYDVDFCIYNDVLVHDGHGNFDIFGYPENVFPPTDFHSATLVGRDIYIVGSLGYPQQRKPGTTPVYRLDCKTWAMEPVECTGNSPGWIHKHKARLANPQQIEFRGGFIQDASGPELLDNTNVFLLDLTNFTWTMKR